MSYSGFGSSTQILTSNGVAETATFQAKSANLHAARYIVSAGGSADGANYTTIAAAITAATSAGAPQTIVIQPGTYTENLTLQPGIDLTAFTGDSSTPTVTIIGKLTFTQAGTVSISNIKLQTNSDYLLAVTGSAASVVNLNNCYLNCSNNTGIDFTSSSSSSSVYMYNCEGNLSTTGIAIFTSSSSGNIFIYNSQLNNTGSSTTANTISSGGLIINSSIFSNPITTSSTAGASILYTELNTAAINTTPLTSGGSGGTGVHFSYLSGGTATAAVSNSVELFLNFCEIDSTNTNALSGSGQIYLAAPLFYTSNGSNVSTQIGGAISGLTKGTTPSAGFIGESFIAAANPSLTSTSVANVASVDLTAGIWDVSGIVNFVVTGGTVATAGISTSNTSFTGAQGDAYGNVECLYTQMTISIPSYRVILSSTTTYYINAQATFGSGGSCFGRISATRVG